jgi:hypothetical protein
MMVVAVSFLDISTDFTLIMISFLQCKLSLNGTKVQYHNILEIPPPEREYSDPVKPHFVNTATRM